VLQKDLEPLSQKAGVPPRAPVGSLPRIRSPERSDGAPCALSARGPLRRASLTHSTITPAPAPPNPETTRRGRVVLCRAARAVPRGSRGAVFSPRGRVKERALVPLPGCAGSANRLQNSDLARTASAARRPPLGRVEGVRRTLAAAAPVRRAFPVDTALEVGFSSTHGTWPFAGFRAAATAAFRAQREAVLQGVLTAGSRRACPPERDTLRPAKRRLGPGGEIRR
jgi:hypothetical protein